VDRTLGYTLDNAWRQARERLVSLEALADPVSIPHLEALGVGEGWRCLEVAAGAGSLADWLCRRVGPSGYVLATDLDPRLLDGLQQPNLEVRQHNILTDPLPEAAFDLVHARNLLLRMDVSRVSVGHSGAPSLAAPDGRDGDDAHVPLNTVRRQSASWPAPIQTSP
jgi:SAM-dependent methyltransferase